jgi:Derlin-2/3
MAENGPEEWYRSLPPITRGYMTASLVTTIVVQMELLDPRLIYLDFDLIMGKLELWRMLTNFVFFGGFGLPFVFSMFFLVRYGKELESKRFEGRAGDMLWFMAFCGLVMQVVVWLMGSGVPFLAQSMLSSLVYLWSREYAEQIISIFGLFNVQAFYFPWVLCAMHKLMGGSPVPDLIGIFAGHVYYFLEDVQGVRIRAPLFLSDALDTPNPAARAAQQHRNAFGGHNWGGGRRLAG